MNYKHLRYFYVVASEGSIAKAASMLHVSPQTISGQLSAFELYLGQTLFDRKGKRLILNESGKLVFGYAEDIFSLGAELQQALRSQATRQQVSFSVGVIDVIPKILASTILKKSYDLEDNIKLLCHEGDFESLLGDLALSRLDLIISDRPIPPGTPVKAYSHFLGESGLSFYAHKSSAGELKDDFPYSLDHYPFLSCSDKSYQKNNLQAWFDLQGITPNIVAEFDDSALMKYFGQSGYGVFSTASTIEQHVAKQYDVEIIGRTTAVNERFYAISPERKVKHPGVKLLIDYAKQFLSSS